MEASSTAAEYRMREIERRVREIEEVKPDIIAERVSQLSRRVDTLIKVGVAILVALVGSAISFAFMALTIRPGH